MVLFDLIFRSMLIKEIDEDKGELCTGDIILWIFINRDSYQCKRVYVVEGEFFPVLSYRWE